MAWFDAGNDDAQASHKVRPLIETRALCAAFADGSKNGGLEALDRLSFAVYPQEFIGVLGPSGCGKSTLLRILAGLLPPTSGEAYFDGQPISGPRSQIGFVFQHGALMPWRTAAENILLPLELQGAPRPAALAKVQELIELVGLQGFEHTRPSDLSGGMAQRVAIARALAHDPDVLLLDEPFGALDALTRERMSTELLRIWQVQRKTVIMVTHSISEALFLADRVLVLSPRPGRLVRQVAVDLPRPREDEIRYTPEFGRLARHIRAAIG